MSEAGTLALGPKSTTVWLHCGDTVWLQPLVICQEHGCTTVGNNLSSEKLAIQTFSYHLPVFKWKTHFNIKHRASHTKSIHEHQVTAVQHPSSTQRKLMWPKATSSSKLPIGWGIACQSPRLRHTMLPAPFQQECLPLALQLANSIMAVAGCTFISSLKDFPQLYQALEIARHVNTNVLCL